MWCLNWPYMFPRKDLQTSIDNLIQPKKENTQKFINFIAQLPGEDKHSIEAFDNAIFLRYMGTINQMRLQFIDANENPTNPPKGFQILLDAEL